VAGVYDEDYESFMMSERSRLGVERPVNYKPPANPYEVKDSGAKAEYGDGMHRDSTEGKPKFRLMWPKGVPYDEQLMVRVARLYEAGGRKYGDRNWEKSSTEESLAHHEEALERHFHKFLNEVYDGEDHAAAIVWNINAVLLTRRNIALEKKRVEEAKAPAPQLNQDWGQTPVAKEGEVLIDGEVWCVRDCLGRKPTPRHQHIPTDFSRGPLPNGS
jgi:hypothetical protein